jgi:hydroxyethylthiazole kinase-like uncharacterized protein yjeF
MPPQPPADVPAVTPQLLRAWPLPDLDDDGTKHDRGTVLVVGGAASTPGAVLLAGIAALRTGAGRLQLATVEATAVALGVAVPEAAVVGLPAGPDGSVSPDAAELVAERAEGAAAVVIGPGLLGVDATRELLASLLPHLQDSRLVLDAVALTALAGHEDLLGGRDGVVLTPNAGELAALLGEDEAEGHDAVARAAKQYDAVIATQGWVVAPDGTAWSDGAGGVGLGTSGSGDVLAGAVGGLLARGAETAQAAVWGRYAHAAAGDRLAAQEGRVGFLARELLDELPAALDETQKSR